MQVKLCLKRNGGFIRKLYISSYEDRIIYNIDGGLWNDFDSAENIYWSTLLGDKFHWGL